MTLWIWQQANQHHRVHCSGMPIAAAACFKTCHGFVSWQLAAPELHCCNITLSTSTFAWLSWDVDVWQQGVAAGPPGCLCWLERTAHWGALSLAMPSASERACQGLGGTH